MNYRLTDDQLRASSPAPRRPSSSSSDAVADASVGAIDGVELVSAPTSSSELRRSTGRAPVDRPLVADPDDIAILLFTSGTTGEPEGRGAAPPPPRVVRHQHASSSSAPTRTRPRWSACRRTTSPASRRSLSRRLHRPPHRATCRRSTPEPWVRTARDEADHPRDGRADDARPDPRRDRARRTSGCRSLRHLVLRRRADAGRGHRAGDGAAARRRLRQRLRAHRDELDDRRARTPTTTARRSPATTRRCAAGSARSAGRCRRSRWRSATPPASRSAPGEPGEICVRGEQVAGEYLGRDDRHATTAGSRPTTPARSTTPASSTSTGRLDDVIVRGGENMSPGEIEDVLRRAPRRRRRRGRRRARRRVGRGGRRRGRRRGGRTATDGRAAGTWVRERLRSTEDADARSRLCDELPYNETGKLLRRVLRDELTERFGS